MIKKALNYKRNRDNMKNYVSGKLTIIKALV